VFDISKKQVNQLVRKNNKHKFEKIQKFKQINRGENLYGISTSTRMGRSRCIFRNSCSFNYVVCLLETCRFKLGIPPAWVMPHV